MDDIEQRLAALEQLAESWLRQRYEADRDEVEELYFAVQAELARNRDGLAERPRSVAALAGALALIDRATGDQ